MNPFLLTGPEFLLFYLGLVGVVLLALETARRRAESGEGPKVNLSDPYLIAYLRGGKNEALRVAALSLVDRGLLESAGSWLETKGADADKLVRRPLEKAILELCRGGALAHTLFEDARVEAATEELKASLTQVGALPDAGVRRARWGRVILAVGVLWVVALARIIQALSRGRYNILFLIGLALAGGLAVARLGNPHRTARGGAILTDVRTLFGHLRTRARSLRPGGGTAEAALLAAAFGINALQGAEWAYARGLQPRSSTFSSGTSYSSCGSSGSSCGSSCGGGGCGGGCGGCGGG